MGRCPSSKFQYWGMWKIHAQQSNLHITLPCAKRKTIAPQKVHFKRESCVSLLPRHATVTRIFNVVNRGTKAGTLPPDLGFPFLSGFFVPGYGVPFLLRSGDLGYSVWFRTGVTNLFGNWELLLGTDSCEGLPIWYTYFWNKSCSICFQLCYH